MKHRSSQIVFAHWNERRQGRAVPERGDIDPSVIRHALADTFILSFDSEAGHPFRLAGTRVCALFGRELRGEAFLPLWSAGADDDVEGLASATADETVGLVAGIAGGTAQGTALELELLLLPLRHWNRSHVRLIGVLAPLEAPYWLGTQPIADLQLREYRYLGREVDGPAPVLAARLTAAERRSGLRVYEGGQA
jgi:hypothetical protein